jgi:hypothetical protein
MQIDRAYSESAETQFRDLIRTPFPVVVASRTSHGIEKARSLGVVPYGDGEISIQHPQGTEAQVVEHWFGGAVTRNRVPLHDGNCRLTVKQENEGGAPLEWIEVNVH